MKKLLIILFILPFIFNSCEPDQSILGEDTWVYNFGEPDVDYGNSVQQTTDGGYIITGSISSIWNGYSDVYLIKTDESGNQQWTQTVVGTGEDIGYSVQQTTDGGYIIAGVTNSFGNGNYDVYLIKTDGNGIEQWTKNFGDTSLDKGRSVQQTTDGGYIITGESYSYEGDAWLIKTDGNGVEQWTKTFGEYAQYFNGKSVQQTTDGGYIIAGDANSNLLGLAHDIYLIKTDGSGNEQWIQKFGGASSDYGNSVQQTTDGGYIITGETYSYGNVSDVYLIKTDGNGNYRWTRTFGRYNYVDYGNSVQQTTDGGYIITGATHSFYNGKDVWLIKTDQNGYVVGW